jgi:hypothetical protein
MKIRDYALKALETAKEDLCRDKYLIPVAFVVTDEAILDFNLEFEDAEQKSAVYGELVKIAKQKGARAIITLNDAKVSNPISVNSSTKAGTRSGGTDAKECIYLTVSGPLIQTWSVCLPYQRLGEEIIFADPSETLNDLLNLLPGWPVEEAGGHIA